MTFEKFAIMLVMLVFAVGLFYRLRLNRAGIKVTSWFRNPFRNEAVGGVANSKHLIGWAFDVVPVHDLVRQKLKNIGFAKILDERTHFHVEIV